MEAFLPMIIIFIIGLLANRKKTEEPKQAKPFVPQNQPSQSARSTKPKPTTPTEESFGQLSLDQLKKVSEDLFRELRGEVRQEVEKFERPTPVQPRAVAKINQPQERERERTKRPSRTEIMTAMKEQAEQISEEYLQKETSVPTTQEEMRKAFIYSEIFGPPKSKR